MIKLKKDGGIVEGGHSTTHGSFGSWDSDIYTMFRPGDRLMIAPNDYIDTIKVYDHTDSNGIPIR